ncbi:hypothetical protein ACP70R_002459 [Stipagrostis hirtigluma subsp. patula]
MAGSKKSGKKLAPASADQVDLDPMDWSTSILDEVDLGPEEEKGVVPTVLLGRRCTFGCDHPLLDEGFLPCFLAFCKCGFWAPASAFILFLLNFYQVELCNFTPNGIAIMAVFAFLCKGFPCVSPDPQSVLILLSDEALGHQNFGAESI